MTNYWIPEDISPKWAKLKGDLATFGARHGNKAMTVGVIAREGYLLKMFKPECKGIEPLNGRRPGQAKEWWPLIRRLQSRAGGREALLTMTVLLNAKGQPIGWTAPERWEMAG